jgi:hypothetical protein
VSPEDKKACDAILDASVALQEAIEACTWAGFGSHVTTPLVDALESVRWVYREATS